MKYLAVNYGLFCFYVDKFNNRSERLVKFIMEMRKCENGHYYDASIHAECPYCTNEGVTGNSGRTIPLAQETAKANVTRPLFAAVQQQDEDDGRTVALIQSSLGIDPVVGWLICVEGREKGRDYRIHSDNNYIGRSEKMDICLRGDETISRENQAVITFDASDNSYYFSPGDGRSIVRVNNTAIFQTVKLEAYDRLIIGTTELLFLPLCGEKFRWEKN